MADYKEIWYKMITEQQKHIIKNILAPFAPKHIGIFGSVARGEANADSDLDILVEFTESYSLFDLVDLKDKLSEALHCKIDLITERSLHPAIKRYVDRDIIFLD